MVEMWLAGVGLLLALCLGVVIGWLFGVLVVMEGDDEAHER